MRYIVEFRLETYVHMVKLCNDNGRKNLEIKSKMADNILTCANLIITFILTRVLYEQINHVEFKNNVFFFRLCNEDKMKASK